MTESHANAFVHESNRPVMQSAPDAMTVIDGQPMLYFGGTGYLGLQSSPEVIEAGYRAVREFGVASATSRGRLGNNPPTLALEQAVADYFHTQAAFYLSSGYFGLTVIIDTLADAWDVLLVDEGSHYAVHEAAQRFSGRVHTFSHCDVDALAEAVLKCLRTDRIAVMTDAVFAAHGCVPPLPAYLELLADRSGSALLIDDAHGVGVLGERGLGTREHLGLLDWPANTLDDDAVRILWTGTLSKAFGGLGGFVTGEQDFIDRLKSASHLYAGASQPSCFDAAASKCGLELAANQPGLRRRLNCNTQRMRRRLGELPVRLWESPMPIVAFQVGNKADMQRLHRGLWDVSICLPYVDQYAGVDAQGLLRATVLASHIDEQIDRVVDELARLL